MEILRAARMGFCHGVRRAYDVAVSLAREADAQSGPAPVYILGDIVHNAEVVARIEAAGIRQVSSPNEIRESHARVLIRTHGCTRQDGELLVARGHGVTDLTCVVVVGVREKAMKLEQRHPAVIVLGRKLHPEVVGLVSWLRNPFVVSDESDIPSIPDCESLGVVSQTTFPRELQRRLINRLCERFPVVEALDTICPHTERNQQTSVEVARQCDTILVIGDEHSSNSRQLYQAVKRVNARAHFLSRPDQVEGGWFPTAGTRRWQELKVGVTAGASTPDWVVSAIVRRIRELGHGRHADPDGRASVPKQQPPEGAPRGT